VTTCVVLLRGVNVGGHQRVPMAVFRTLLEGIGGLDVQTYVQSGNAVLTWPGPTADLAPAVAAAVHAELGLTVPVLVRTAAELTAVIAGCPWPDLDPRLLHAVFLTAAADPDRVAAVDHAGLAPERVAVGDRVSYAFYAGGVQRSRLARLDVGGGPGTARNWRTVTALAALCT